MLYHQCYTVSYFKAKPYGAAGKSVQSRVCMGCIYGRSFVCVFESTSVVLEQLCSILSLPASPCHLSLPCFIPHNANAVGISKASFSHFLFTLFFKCLFFVSGLLKPSFCLTLELFTQIAPSVVPQSVTFTIKKIMLILKYIQQLPKQVPSLYYLLMVCTDLKRNMSPS